MMPATLLYTGQLQGELVSDQVLYSNFYACLRIRRGVLNIVIMLLDNGADINAVNKQRETALFKAVAGGHVGDPALFPPSDSV